jgi:YbbR domain-containing protein
VAFREIVESTSRLPAFLQLARSWLRGLFLEDWGLKLLAWLITLGLWYGVTGQRRPATVRIPNVQLSYRVPPQMEISNDARREVEVTLTGAERSLNRITSRDLIAYVDLSDYQQGDRTLRLTPLRVSMGLPDGVRIDDIEPNTIPLKLEPRLERELEVAPRIEGTPAEGYEVRALHVAPASIKVRGPQSHVARLDKAPTEVVRVDGKSSPFTETEVAIELKDDKVDAVEPVVNVTVEIAEKRVEKVFMGVPVTSESKGRPSPSTATVVLYGPISTLEKLSASDLKLLLKENGDGGVAPTIILPPGRDAGVELKSTLPTGFSIRY